MTRRISLVAVCCSSASVSSRFRAPSSWNEALVLDGDRRLVGEGPEERDLLRGERPDPRPPDDDEPDGDTIAQERRREHGAECRVCARAPGIGAARRPPGMSRTWIVRRSRTARPLGSSRVIGIVWPSRRSGSEPVDRHEPELVTLHPVDVGIRASQRRAAVRAMAWRMAGSPSPGGAPPARGARRLPAPPRRATSNDLVSWLRGPPLVSLRESGQRPGVIEPAEVDGPEGSPVAARGSSGGRAR